MSGFAYSNNGTSFRAVDSAAECQSGEVYFAETPTRAQLQAAFAGYVAALAVDQALATYAAAMGAGLTIASTGTPAVNGTYALDQAQQNTIVEVTVYIEKNNAFPGGIGSAILRTTSGGELAIPSVALWYEISTAIADYVAKLDSTLIIAQSGRTPSWPVSNVTIT